MIAPAYVRVMRKVFCKGGGGGDTYDAAYNARMATIAEEQQGWAKEMYDWYLHGSGGTPGHYEKTLVSEGGRKWVEGEHSSPHRSPKSPGYWKETDGYWEETDPVYEETWVEGTGGYSYRDMENDQLEYNREEIAAAMGLLPEQTNLQRDQLEYDREEIASAMGLLPRTTALAHAQIGDEMTNIKERAPVRTEFYQQALEGMDPQRMANLAAADASQAFMNAEAGNRRASARAGVGPDSGRYAAMSNSNAMNRAKVIGGASTRGRFEAENQNFGRLQSAMGLGG